MKLSISMYSFNDIAEKGKMSVDEFVDTCVGYGVFTVDLLEYYWKDKEKEVKAIPAMLKAKGVELGAFCVGNNFLVPAEEMSGQIDYVKEGIDTAAKLGAKRLRIFGGDWPESKVHKKGDNKEAIDLIVEASGKCADYAKKSDITLVMENHNGIPASSGDLLTILKMVDSPFLKVNFDIGNFLTGADENPLDALEKLYPYVGLIHIKDMSKENTGEKKYKNCITGEGSVPVKECLKTFKQKGYDSYASLEYEAWEVAGSMVGVKKSIEYLKKVMKEI